MTVSALAAFVLIVGEASNAVVVEAEVEEVLDIRIVGCIWHNPCWAVGRHCVLILGVFLEFGHCVGMQMG